MEQQTTWKGHSFTLLVFAGLVVLCSIFFILGMLVGRDQGQKIVSAAAAAVKPEAKPAPDEDKSDFTFYEAVKKDESALLPPPPTKADPPPEVRSKPGNVINYQITALRKSADADRLLDLLKKKGFRAFILAPAANDPNPFYRVQVGPLADGIEAQNVKKKLESLGYKPILRK